MLSLGFCAAATVVGILKSSSSCNLACEQKLKKWKAKAICKSAFPLALSLSCTHTTVPQLSFSHYRNCNRISVLWHPAWSSSEKSVRRMPLQLCHLLRENIQRDILARWWPWLMFGSGGGCPAALAKYRTTSSVTSKLNCKFPNQRLKYCRFSLWNPLAFSLSLSSLSLLLLAILYFYIKNVKSLLNLLSKIGSPILLFMYLSSPLFSTFRMMSFCLLFMFNIFGKSTHFSFVHFLFLGILPNVKAFILFNLTWVDLHYWLQTSSFALNAVSAFVVKVCFLLLLSTAVLYLRASSSFPHNLLV